MSTLDDRRPGARREDLECTIHPFGSLEGKIFVVVVSEFNGKIMLSRHKKRSTWETQGGHIDPGESPEAAAMRELTEESGALEFNLTPVCYYHGYNRFGSANGAVYHAEILKMGDMPDSEMAEICFFDKLPPNLTYPRVTPRLFEEAFIRLGRE